jgi:catechol-2,3-dioxygenase
VRAGSPRDASARRNREEPMHLNHLNLCVDDLTEARTFFAELFDFRTINQRGDALTVMTDGYGFTLVLSSAGAFRQESPRYPEGFHVGFIVETPAQVDTAHARIAEAGFALGPPRAVHGSYAFYFTALSGILFEVSCQS